MISPVLFDTNRSFKRQNTLSLVKGLFIKVSMARRSRFVIFSSGKSVVFRHASASRLRNANVAF